MGAFRNYASAARRRVFARVALVCLSLGALQGAAQEDGVDNRWREAVTGELRTGLDLARSNRDSDVMLDQILRLRIDPPKHKRLKLRSTLWTIEDLDGQESPTSTLRTINDASNATIQTRLLALYLEIDDPAGSSTDSTVRIGRQRIVDGVIYNRIDGLFLKWRNPNWDWYTFVGARASVYEDAHEDLASGGGIALRLPTNTRVSVDLFYGEDERRRFGTDDIESSVTSLSVNQALTGTHYLYGRGTWHENDLDEFHVAAQGVFTGSEIVYTLSYRKRFSTLTERVTDVTDFFRVLGELNEFDDYQAIVHVPLSEMFAVGFEAQVHDAARAAFPTGNRDFQRYGVSLDAYGLREHYDASVIVEYWGADQGEDQWTVTGEVSRKWTESYVTVGTDYTRFEDRVSSFDPALVTVFFVETHENVYTVYSKFGHNISDSHSIGLYAGFQDDDGPDSPYWRLRAHYTLRF